MVSKTENSDETTPGTDAQVDAQADAIRVVLDSNDNADDGENKSKNRTTTNNKQQQHQHQQRRNTRDNNSINNARKNNNARDNTRNNNNDTNTKATFSNFSTASDDEFCMVIMERLNEDPISKQYPKLFNLIPNIFLKWRKRYSVTNPKLWKRLFDLDRVIKEFIEACPVIDSVLTMIENEKNQDDEESGEEKKQKQCYTIIDLCSGKGYLGMILSEMLPPSKIFRIVLMDIAWPMRNVPNAKSKPQHINWDHIYGKIGGTDEIEIEIEIEKGKTKIEDENENETTNVGVLCQDIIIEDDNGTTSTSSTPPNTYYDTWPIPIDTSKQDLKSSRQLKKISEHFLSNKDHPVIMIGIHLCGILSMRAIDLYNTNRNIKFFVLKPCCLPGMVHAKRKEIFSFNKDHLSSLKNNHPNQHTFKAEDVCVHGKWKRNKWINGPPRSHLQPKFIKWCTNLYHGINEIDYDDDINNNNNNNKLLTAETTTTAESSGSTEDNDDSNSNNDNDVDVEIESLTINSNDNSVVKQPDGDDDDNVAVETITETKISTTTQKLHTRIQVQHDGGFQNDFIFAERLPISSTKVWYELNKYKVEVEVEV